MCYDKKITSYYDNIVTAFINFFIILKSNILKNMDINYIRQL